MIKAAVYKNVAGNLKWHCVIWNFPWLNFHRDYIISMDKIFIKIQSKAKFLIINLSSCANLSFSDYDHDR